MVKHKKPLKRGVLVGTIIFILLLCIVLSAAQYYRYQKMLYSRYEANIENILSFVAGKIDTDDLAECIRTGETSEKYDELQELLDYIRGSVNIHFIYVIEPLNTEPVDNIKNIIAGVSEYEYEYMQEYLVHLNMLTGDSYSPETAAKYLNAYNSGKLSFFEEISEWGDDYTGLLPLYDSQGNKICALCVDVDIASIHSELRSNIISMILTIVAIGVVFGFLFYAWTTRNVTRPLELLESSVTDYAESCEGQKNPEALKIEVPEIKADNEVGSLASAVTKMSEAMQGYVKNIVYTESELSRMALLANTDALTGIRNKNAYDAFTIDLQARMRKTDFDYAVAMIDLNGLKDINDTYGHEKGDVFIQQCCSIICKAFMQSDIFRIGGDEFVAVMQQDDFNRRGELVARARTEFEKRCKDESLNPWERCSAAIGIAEYIKGKDSSVEEVLSRADRDMYAEKNRMKHSS